MNVESADGSFLKGSESEERRVRARSCKRSVQPKQPLSGILFWNYLHLTAYRPPLRVEIEFNHDGYNPKCSPGGSIVNSIPRQHRCPAGAESAISLCGPISNKSTSGSCNTQFSGQYAIYYTEGDAYAALARAEEKSG
jgi:hypothetical protein